MFCKNCLVSVDYLIQSFLPVHPVAPEAINTMLSCSPLWAVKKALCCRHVSLWNKVFKLHSCHFKLLLLHSSQATTLLFLLKFNMVEINNPWQQTSRVPFVSDALSSWDNAAVSAAWFKSSALHYNVDLTLAKTTAHTVWCLRWWIIDPEAGSASLRGFISKWKEWNQVAVWKKVNSTNTPDLLIR